ncbi:MAG TPA: XdhC family protein [Candidatus Elarobacter sp.]|jgi:xanthine dehydrogenase accessory factor|nr:XdhC family protein [Candidatus Elarobacter sp.]
MSFYARLAELERERSVFAVATVVARRAPVSSHLGDRALVFADGRMEGFVGGSCSRDIVRRESLRAIRSGLPRLVQIRSDVNASEPGSRDEDCVVVAMGCASEGAVDVYLEPHVPRRRLLIVGDTPVAASLARIAAQIPYDVVRVVVEAELATIEAAPPVRAIALASLQHHLDACGADERAHVVAVVASQGHYDEEALAPLLSANLPFVGLLASRRRAAAIAATLTAQGVAAERIAALHVPVGLDIGARAPGEVAISIVAEIIAGAPPLPVDPDDLTAPETAIDPVCGMEVEVATARHHLEHGGHLHYFCCAGCRASFVADLERV